MSTIADVEATKHVNSCTQTNSKPLSETKGLNRRKKIEASSLDTLDSQHRGGAGGKIHCTSRRSIPWFGIDLDHIAPDANPCWFELCKDEVGTTSRGGPTIRWYVVLHTSMRKINKSLPDKSAFLANGATEVVFSSDRNTSIK